MMDLLDKITALEHEAANFGFQWENTEQIMAQIQGECLEISEHLHAGSDNLAGLQEEIGDLLHAVFSLTVFCNFEPRSTLEQTLEKFERRLAAVKVISREQGHQNLQGFAFEELMNIWRKAKARVG